MRLSRLILSVSRLPWWSLLGQQGSTVNFGNLLVVPLANSLLYVEPMFVLAQSNAVPLLEYVITATSTRVAFSTTLQDSLQLLVNGQTSGGTTGTVTTTPTPSGGGGTPGGGGGSAAQTLAQQALQHFQAAQAAAAKGDFAAEGQELAQAYALLQQAASPSASPSPSGSASPSPSPSKS